MLRSIDFKTMPYLFTDKAGTCLTVEFDGRGVAYYRTVLFF